jgi:Winged helix DNA-binding domain
MAGAVRRIGVQERRARLGVRHHLAPAARAAGVVQVAEDLVGLHGTDPASVFLAAAARMRQPEVGAIERALYHDRVLLRMLGMRRTMFVVPVELAPIVQAACTNAIAAAQRRLLLQLLEQSGIAADDPERWLEEVEEATVKALAARGQALASELAEDEPRLREQILLAEGKSYAARQSVVTRVLLVLAAEGRIARGRPRGSWISGQYRWSLIESWLPGGMAGWSTEAAQAELVRRWLAAFGPGTVADLRWWTGLTAGQVKRALAAVGAVEVDLDGVPGLVLAGDLAPLAAPEPWVALLPALDPTVMGWSGRGWYLGDHGPTLFDRNGNAGPTVWWDGRIVGGWASRKDGEIAVRLLEDVGADAAAAVEAAAGGLADWLGPVRVTPRFRTPLERDLSA